jgi:hypothetical protein
VAYLQRCNNINTKNYFNQKGYITLLEGKEQDACVWKGEQEYKRTKFSFSMVGSKIRKQKNQEIAVSACDLASCHPKNDP